MIILFIIFYNWGKNKIDEKSKEECLFFVHKGNIVTLVHEDVFCPSKFLQEWFFLMQLLLFESQHWKPMWEINLVIEVIYLSLSDVTYASIDLNC